MPSVFDPPKSPNKLQQARAWSAKQFSSRWDGHGHPSHLAAKILEEADDKFQLGSDGVEGWAENMKSGVSYLNFGDPYDPTIVVKTSSSGASFFYASNGYASFVRD